MSYDDGDVIEYVAGACPLTDAVRNNDWCFDSRCNFQDITVDLASERLVGLARL